MFSIYTTAYLINANNFQFISHLINFSNFVGPEGEVIVATCKEGIEDGTDQTLYDFIKSNALKNVKLIISKDIKFSDPAFDGKLKNFALQNTKNSVKILLDLDETIQYHQRDLWLYYFEKLKEYNLDGWLIPSVNLAGDIYHYKDIQYKMYLHRDGLQRGVWKDALNKDGSIDIKMSDTTECLLPDGSLAKFGRLPNDIETLRKGPIPYVFHHWAVDKEARIRQNKFWKPHWENRAKREVTDIILNKENLDRIEVFEHKLKIT